MNTGLAIETEALGKTYYARWGGREITAVAGLSLQVPAGTNVRTAQRQQTGRQRWSNVAGRG